MRTNTYQQCLWGPFAHDTSVTTPFGCCRLGCMPRGRHTPLPARDGLLLLLWWSHYCGGLQDQNGSKGRLKRPDGDAEHYGPSLFTGKGTGKETGDQWHDWELNSLLLQVSCGLD